MGWVVKDTPWPLSPRDRAGNHCIGVWVGPEPLWTDAENPRTVQHVVSRYTNCTIPAQDAHNKFYLKRVGGLG